MCGIAFLYADGRDPLEIQDVMNRALGSMEHRGPDDSRLITDGQAVCGHRRLSIIDISGSHQPMRSPDGRYILTFNGEIYTYKKIRASLAGRWEFVTNGDTEVLLAGLLLEGVDFISCLEGMWAFALWDTVGESLLLCRDRMGKKPLYYLNTGDDFSCASELSSLRMLSNRTWHEDQHSTADYLRYGYCLPGYTAYENVREVLPGHYLIWTTREGSIQERPYWSLSTERFTGNEVQAAQKLRDALITATKRRMVADVEVGAFLSGGIDSSLIVGIARQELGVDLKTFTIGFEEHAYDERQYAKQISDIFSTEHYEEIFSELNEDHLEKLILKHMGQPFADASLLPTTLVSLVASRYVKVALSGDGGDELFSGYQRYQARMMLRWYTRLPQILRKNVATLIRALPEPMAHHSHSLLKKAHLFADVADRLDAETPYYAPHMFNPILLEDLAPDTVKLGHHPPNIPDITEPGDLQRMMLADASVYLPQDILVKVDRASMSQSLETRAPFLDREVVELAFSLPSNWHRNDFGGKRMLHQAFKNLLPPITWRRRKQGFGVPLHDWFRGFLGTKLQDLLSEDTGPLQADIVCQMHRAHERRKTDHANRLWMIYNYLLWRNTLL
ncbi:MAG: asparagine synthase (glutamine-hydrolyzing) [Desulforhopalus sp.]